MRCNSRCNSKRQVYRAGVSIGFQQTGVGAKLAWLPSKSAGVALVRMSRYASWYAQNAMAQAMQVQVQRCAIRYLFEQYARAYVREACYSPEKAGQWVKSSPWALGQKSG